MDLHTTKQLKNGAKMPVLGLGVWKAPKKYAYQSVLWALEAGIRLIDTAKIYGNEEAVGAALKDSRVPREEIFLTTKLWNGDQGYDKALKAVDESMKRLGVTYLDLYLIHWPFRNVLKVGNKRKETWKAMEEIFTSRKAKAIGVSNYTVAHLQEMNEYKTISPDVDQVEFHPFLYQKDLLEYCNDNEIALEAYCPLTHGRAIEDDRITEIAKKYERSNAQVLIRWGLQHDEVVIPKSNHKERILENSSVFDFSLSDTDMKALDALDSHTRFCWNPET